MKNSLARRAAAETGRDALLAYLEGPTAIAWVAGDAAVAAKALNGFAAEHPAALTVKGACSRAPTCRARTSPASPACPHASSCSPSSPAASRPCSPASPEACPT